MTGSEESEAGAKFVSGIVGGLAVVAAGYVCVCVCVLCVCVCVCVCVCGYDWTILMMDGRLQTSD